MSSAVVISDIIETLVQYPAHLSLARCFSELCHNLRYNTEVESCSDAVALVVDCSAGLDTKSAGFGDCVDICTEEDELPAPDSASHQAASTSHQIRPDKSASRYAEEMHLSHQPRCAFPLPSDNRSFRLRSAEMQASVFIFVISLRTILNNISSLYMFFDAGKPYALSALVTALMIASLITSAASVPTRSWSTLTSPTDTANMLSPSADVCTGLIDLA